MRVLVTGIGGFVGAHLVGHIFKNTDWEVMGIDSFRHKGKTDRIADLLKTYPEYRARLTIITHDLLAPISVQMRSKIGAIDYIFNIASESHVDRSIDEPGPFIQNNVNLCINMLEYARLSLPKAFIQCSTDEVYGPALLADHPEGDPHRPSNPYAASKAAQEDICYAYWRTYNVPIMITNTMNMIGQLQDVEKYVPKIIKAISEGATVVAHVSPQGVPGSRYYLHVRNMCDAMVFLAQHCSPTLYPAPDIDRYNIVSDVEVDNVQLPNLVASIMAKPLLLETQNFHESRPGHDLRYGLTNDKLEGLGWTPPVSFEEGLQTTVEWYMANPDWLQADAR
jgi:dTDP-glucose 4,6-dehydratase